jgi:hypothetical protein
VTTLAEARALNEAVIHLGSDEGWAIFDSCGSDSGPLQVQGFDDEGVPDEWGWLRIWQRACSGDFVAQWAMRGIADENPREVDLIVLWNCQVHPDSVPDVMADLWPHPFDFRD